MWIEEHLEQGMVNHACSFYTQVEAEGSPQGSGQPGLHSMTVFFKKKEKEDWDCSTEATVELCKITTYTPQLNHSLTYSKLDHGGNVRNSCHGVELRVHELPLSGSWNTQGRGRNI